MERVQESHDISLESVRAEGWYDQLRQAPNFERLSQILGEKFIAFAVIAGVRITAIEVDPQNPAGTTIEFALGQNSSSVNLPLFEFRERLAMTLVLEEAYPDALELDPQPDALQEFIGVRYVLLAELFGIRLSGLRIEGGDVPMIQLEDEDGEREISLTSLRDRVDDLVRAEAAQRPDGSSPFAIDLAIVARAREATEAADWEGVVHLLGSWPGPLSMLLRTQEGQLLDGSVRAALARALGLLGTAYVNTDRHEWAEEVMRLGIQWGQGSDATSDLFRRMGESHLRREHFGQAIGFLRRALSLGALQKEVLPLLAEAYHARGRNVAAAACLDEVHGSGTESPELERLRARVHEAIGPQWARFRERIAAPTAAAMTMPAPEA